MKRERCGFKWERSPSELERLCSEHENPTFLLKPPSLELDHCRSALEAPSLEHEAPTFVREPSSLELEAPTFLLQASSLELGTCSLEHRLTLMMQMQRLEAVVQ